MTWHPDIPEEYRNQIVTGDARELAKRIPDESIDLIFTDPVYDRIEDYEWLAETAVRVLKPDRACLACCGILHIDYSISVMRNHLDYRWLVGGFYQARAIPYRWFPCIWMDKGKTKRLELVWDMQPINRGHKLPDADTVNHKWQKPIHWIARFIEALCPQNGIALDPFCGGGAVAVANHVLSRNYIAFEIDPEIADLARERVLNTQPPLFVPEPEQLELP